ncbi:unnamed protein product [marine sediment metagenome]|uniref:Uncharacterized protein n=1 Tax=marine sediment metagenome TaxID=412755 RepID=X1BP85_9ZZZZ
MKKLFPSTQNLNKSVRNVMGDRKDMNTKLNGIVWRGTKIPLINSKGNLMRFMIIITSEVISVGLAATNKPNNEPKIDMSPIPKNIKNIVISELKPTENISTKIIVIIEVIISE